MPIGLILLVAGLVLKFAGPWFDGQETVGNIFLIVFAALVVFYVLVIVVWGAIFSKSSRW